MFASIVISVFVLIVAIIVYVEYKNEKTYQEERKRRSEARRTPKPSHKKPEEKIRKPEQKQKERVPKRKTSAPASREPLVPHVKKEREPLPDDISATKPSEKKERAQKRAVEEIAPAVKTEEKTYELPACKYPEFDYSRLLKMGLSENEAIEFIKELIPQLKSQIPLIKEAMDKEDFHSMERLTHSIKGSSTTVGTGGVSDLLSEFNTYLKTGKEVPVAEAYFKNLNRYTDELEKQFA